MVGCGAYELSYDGNARGDVDGLDDPRRLTFREAMVCTRECSVLGGAND
jgi:hypothetical protein